MWAIPRFNMDDAEPVNGKHSFHAPSDCNSNSDAAATGTIYRPMYTGNAFTDDAIFVPPFSLVMATHIHGAAS
jgi:hypothetical protein